MTEASLGSMLLSSTDPTRLYSWYTHALRPRREADIDGYHMLQFGEFYLMIDTRDDVGEKNPEPGRMILNFDVTDARTTAARIDELGAGWLVPMEDRDGSLFGTAIDPDGNYVQLIQLSPEHLAQMAQM
ncbi:VOC family protein [Phytoactinopolyspora limicola]|uniref:VOC family protein n=1 Tax=Phytoactinopolyspora limicola TaxID=2715536 RepID=UPI00140A7185|nr:VOC family protein [Phytoactinopolyspora limicola]